MLRCLRPCVALQGSGRKKTTLGNGARLPSLVRCSYAPDSALPHARLFVKLLCQGLDQKAPVLRSLLGVLGQLGHIGSYNWSQFYT